MLKRNTGILIEKDRPDYNRIKRDLTRQVREWNDDWRTIILYSEKGDGILVPRMYPVNEKVKDCTVSGDSIKVKSSVKPRSKRQKRAIKYMTSNTNGILKLEPGSGKTVLSIDSICKIGKRAIVLVHKLELAKQWIEQIVEFTDLNEEDIGFVRSNNYKKELKKPISVAMIQTLVSVLKREDYENELQDSGIGVSIFDECHTTVGPEVFSRVSYNINSKVVIGLSATPSRNDCEDVLWYHLGDTTYFPPDENEILKPIIYLCHFPFGIYNRYKQYINWGGNFQYGRYDKQMIKSESYLDTTASLIRSAHKGGKKVIVMGKRVNVLLELARRVRVNKDKIGIFISSAKPEEKLEVSDTTDLKEAFHTKDIVFATYGMARDGNNRVDFDCLVMTVPTSNVVQAVGRICRTKEGKSIPIVLDLIDTEGPMERSFNDFSKQVPKFIKSMERRIGEYIQLGWDYKYSKINISRK